MVKIRLIALILGVCLLAGCAAAPAELQRATGGETLPTLPEGAVFIPEEYADKTIQESYAQLEWAYPLTLENVRGNAQALVSGVVTGFTNVIVGDTVPSPWTVIHLCDAAVLSGEAKVAADGSFDVYVYGGYMPNGESVIHQVYDGAELPALGEPYAFYLTRRESGEPRDCYESPGGSYSRLYIQGDCYIRRGYGDEGVQVFTKEELLG